MNNIQVELSLSYRSIALAPSLQCDANCRHCLFKKSIRRSSCFDKRFFFDLVRRLPKEITNVALTGGEPFFNLKTLFGIASTLSKFNFEFSIVTNGLWTRRTNNALCVINALRSLGLTGIIISFDEYHKPRLSEQELRTVLLGFSSRGLRIGVKSCGKEMELFVHRTREFFKRREIPAEIEHFSLERVGSAEKCQKDLANKRICNACKMIGTPLVFTDGRVFACCSAEILEFRNDWLVRGNSKKEPIEKILRRSERDFRLIAVAALGPAGLAKIVGVKPKKDETSCELCVRILNNGDYRKELEERLEKDKRLRQEVVGRFFLLSHKLYEKEKKQREKWREYFRRIGVEG